MVTLAGTAASDPLSTIHARARHAAKRGGSSRRTTLADAHQMRWDDPAEILSQLALRPGLAERRAIGLAAESHCMRPVDLRVAVSLLPLFSSFDLLLLLGSRVPEGSRRVLGAPS